MTHTPKTAGSHERDIIDSLVQRQVEVLQSLDELNLQIEAAVEQLKAERQAQMQVEEQDESKVLAMPAAAEENSTERTVERAA